jgi:DNA-binding transcriptional LysR family regulator
MRVLREVAVRGSFSAAAEALSFTQSAVSQQIAALERETGATLVERSARGVRLTDAGRALVKHTDAILARLTEAESELEAIAGLRGGRVRMAAFESACATLMPPAIAQYRSHHPAVELSMTLSEPEDSLPQLRSGEIELAVIFGGALAESYSIEGLELVELMEDPLYLVLPADHALARKRNIRLVDLAHEPWIGGPVDCECTALIRRSCAAAGYDPRITFEIDDYGAVQGLVAAGVGVSLIAEMGLSSVRDDIVVRSLGRDAPVRRVYAAVHDGGYRSPATAAMLDVLREVAERLSARRPELELVG